VALSDGSTRALRASALSGGGRALTIAGLPHGTATVRVRLAAEVVARGHRCALWARLHGGAGPPASVVQPC
jgi:hypothetical protein